VFSEAGIPEHRVLVSGTASRSVPADRAVWALVVVEIGEAPAEAFGRCGQRLDALTRALRDALGEEAEVRTGALSVQPQRDPDGRRLETVEVRGQVTVDVQVEAAGRASAAAMSAGADRLDGPTLEVRDATAIGEELLTDAVAGARRKAERIASAAGRRLGQVVSVAEEVESGGQLRYAVAISASSGWEGPELEPSDARIEASVQVLFALED
jgi:uncharacterized protein YggE